MHRSYVTRRLFLCLRPRLQTPSDPIPGGGPGWFYRGIRLAAGSAKFLVRNKQLLWFSFLTGLALLFMFVSVFSLIVSTSYPYKSVGYPVFLALLFAVQLVTVFCLLLPPDRYYPECLYRIFR